MRRRKLNRAEEAKARLALVQQETRQHAEQLQQQWEAHPAAQAGGGEPVAAVAAAAGEWQEWAPPADGRTEIERLRSLLENGVGRAFDLAGWCRRESCGLPPRQRLELILQQCRPEVLKLFVMEDLAAAGASEQEADELTYGEILPGEFERLLRTHVKLPADDRGIPQRGTFCDLGCGVGKCALLAACSGLFVDAFGVELLRCLSSIGEAFVEDYNDSIVGGSACPARIATADFFADTRWVVADFVYTCTIMFSDATMAKLATLAAGMKPGSLFASVMMPLPSTNFTVVACEDYRFSWGSVEVYVHRRNPTTAEAGGHSTLVPPALEPETASAARLGPPS